jgi:DNA-binding NarL/FixJ family response regulator
MEKITVLISDDHQLVLDSWRYLLNADGRFHVVAVANGGMQAVELAANYRPRIVLMDINMTGSEIDGFEATRLIRKAAPGSKIIGVSMHSMPAYVKRMLKSGASGYVTKSSSLQEMIKTILEVNESRVYICEEVKNIIIKNEIEPANGPDINLLSKRELEVIQYISRGLSSKEISGELHLSLKTIEVHRYNILKKLKLPNSAALVNFVNHYGL